MTVTTSEAPVSRVVFTFNSDAQARGLLERSHDLTLLGGGLGSGKTTLHGLDLIQRAKHETDQLGGIFTNTQATLEKGVFTEIAKIFRLAGMEQPKYGGQPPRAWVRRWIAAKIEIPPIAAYRNVLTTPEGVHVVCGTLHNQSFHQFETIQLAWIRFEEVINNSLEAVDTLMERVRCLTGGKSNPDCARYHWHSKHWLWNPPRGAHPWLYGKLHQLEDVARDYYHALREGETCPGCWLEIPDDDGTVRRIPKAHGPELDHRKWPLLLAGIGPALWIKSKTSDNTANNTAGYRQGLAVNMSKSTAARRLDGEVIEATEGRAYTEYSTANISDLVPYDPDRTLYMFLDFNLSPRAAAFGHQLNPGEYPGEYKRAGITDVGIFGEYFYAGEMSDRNFAKALVRGERGDGCEIQPRYRSEELRGLPASCDETCEPVCRKGHWNGLRGHRGRIVAFGDQRGTHRSSHSDNLESSWQIVDQVFRQLGNYGKDVPDVQPAPRARVDSVNGKFCNESGIRSLFFHPRCEESLRDCDQVQWDETGMYLREWRFGLEMLRTHLLDGIGFGIVRLFPLGIEMDSSGDIPKTHRKKRERIPSFI